MLCKYNTFLCKPTFLRRNVSFIWKSEKMLFTRRQHGRYNHVDAHHHQVYRWIQNRSPPPIMTAVVITDGRWPVVAILANSKEVEKVAFDSSRKENMGKTKEKQKLVFGLFTSRWSVRKVLNGFYFPLVSETASLSSNWHRSAKPC